MESKGEVRFPEMPAVILEKVIQYMYYKVGLLLVLLDGFVLDGTETCWFVCVE